MTAALIDHLWQSTIAVGVAGALVAVCRRNRPAVRYAIWWAASVKFLVPLAALVPIGNVIEREPFSRQVAEQIPVAVSSVVVRVGLPFSAAALEPPASQAARDWTTAALLAIWACGCLAILIRRTLGWRRVHATASNSEPIALADTGLPAGTELRASPQLMEPGVIGFWRQAIVMPTGLAQRLPAAQLRAVLAHELCHIRRRDNLTAAVHMVVEALFWFHPLVWWIGARLVEERERACDEYVLNVTGDSRTYADGILTICRHYMDSPLTCVAGVNGGDIKSRIEAIMHNRTPLELSAARRLALASACAAAVTLPILIGVLDGPAVSAQAADTRPRLPPFEVVSIRPTGPDLPKGLRQRRISAGVIDIEGYAIPLLLQSAFGVRGYQLLNIPEWATTARFNVTAKAATPVGTRDLWAMMVPVLEERFQLRTHREMRELPVYKLTVEKAGRLPEPKATCFDPNEPLPPAVRTEHGQRPLLACGAPFSLLGPRVATIWGTKIRMAALAAQLTDLLRRHVLDQTGISEAFDVELRFALSSVVGIPLVPDADPDAADVFTAVREQLGLRLESGTAPVEMLVVDRIERPSEN